MFDLIKAKYEIEENAVELQQRVQTSEGVTPDVEVHEVFKLNYGTIGLNLVLLISAISLIIYGGVHLEDCPAEKRIAISLMGFGAVVLLSRILNGPNELQKCFGSTNVTPKNRCLIWLTLILQLVVIGWFIAMCYFVYKIKNSINKEDPNSPMYCEDDYYKSVFWGSTVGLTSIAIVFFLTCMLFIHMRVTKRG